MTAAARRASFTGLTPFAEALAWIGAHTGRLPAEVVPVRNACWRVLERPLAAAASWPDTDRAAIDGWAVSARETEGASEYNPLALHVAIPVVSGTAMPDGTDAVVASPILDSNGPVHHVLATVARGAGVERRGSDAPEGYEVPAGVLRPEAVAMLELLGLASVAVTRPPRVALMVAGPKSGPDVLTPMLCALIARDGGTAHQAAEFDALSVNSSDLLLSAGRAGLGRDDDMAARLKAAGGALHLHGLAIRPGRSTGLGTCHGVPAVLLPGTPDAALSAYEMLVGPGVRSMGGLGPVHVTQPLILGRKITSMVGMTDMIRVQVVGDRVVPLGPADTGGLGRAVLSDGWIVVPDGHEGYPAGATVMVHRLGNAGA